MEKDPSEVAQLLELQSTREQRHQGPWGLPDGEGILPTFPGSRNTTTGPSGLKLNLGLRKKKLHLKLLQKTVHMLHGYEGLTY